MSEEQQIPVETTTARRRGLSAEWRKFLALCIILLLVVLGVAGARPFIFERIIPAVMGENVTRATLQEDENEPVKEEPLETDAGVPDAANSAVDEAPGEETSAEPAADESDTGEEAPAADNIAEPEPPVEAPPAVTHTVARGENLTMIARQYNVTVEALIAANEIQNPNQVLAGDVLIIPQP